MCRRSVVMELAARPSDGERAAPRAGPGGRAPAVDRLTLRQVTVVAGMLLMPLAVIVLASAALLRMGGWTGAALVLAGTLMLAIGIGLVSAPAHARRLASRDPRTAGPAPLDGEPRPDVRET